MRRQLCRRRGRVGAKEAAPHPSIPRVLDRRRIGVAVVVVVRDGVRIAVVRGLTYLDDLGAHRALLVGHGGRGRALRGEVNVGGMAAAGGHISHGLLVKMVVAWRGVTRVEGSVILLGVF